jgi:PRTRC genetic system ThiF family protein
MITFDPHLNIGNSEIILVGLGGTGSALARHVCRTIYHMKQLNLQYPKTIKFVDPDVVELKNVGRQSFVVADVGQHKAELLARRFNAALGLGIQWFNEPFDVQKHCPDRYGNAVLLGSVDNHLARRELSKAAGVWIDAGNDRTTGQVVIGNTSSVSVVQNMLEQQPRAKAVRHSDFVEHGTRADGEPLETWRHLPNAAMIFPALLEPEPAPTSNIIDLSCADLVSTGEQHLLINDMISGIAAKYFYDLAFRRPIASFMTFLDLDSLAMRSIRIDRENIAAYLPEAV